MRISHYMINRKLVSSQNIPRNCINLVISYRFCVYDINDIYFIYDYKHDNRLTYFDLCCFFQFDNMSIPIEDVDNVQDLLNSVSQVIAPFNGYYFDINCTFVCKAIPGTNDTFNENFSSVNLQTNGGGVNVLHSEIHKLAKKLKDDDFCDFNIKAVINILITLKYSDR